MKLNDLWPLASQVLVALIERYVPALDRAAAAAGAGDEWYLLLTAACVEPEPLTIERLLVRARYTAPVFFADQIDRAVEQEWLAPDEQGYYLTWDGRRLVERLIAVGREAMAQLKPLPYSNLVRLASLLGRIYDAALTSPYPPGTWCLRTTASLDPGRTAPPPVVRIDQYLSGLEAFRDDAHLAAWAPWGVSAAAMEALTLLWRGEAVSLNEVCEQLLARQHSRTLCVAALDELRARGWVDGPNEALGLSEEGCTWRDTVEARTDEYFYRPWIAALKEGELSELRDLLTRCCEGLHSLPVVELE